mmetsp:Transcript_10442/g.29715  ORF Transcript_10442/g.29715 Transcript_10442/m.29715 type:complete len:525 (-) Transcript_10442:261-1835(-)|eukprot:CAMPEP_0117659920 /NCGR_PEP_ID=MMETSP0804-20121206/6687_1 /TAXON_ID=1074897 /ORGANISM="Tetraselmis astigmatica, Strain CCMP880" /LENGTH=524 /DNA_ID=CAMNT_0005466605 /DNA_START=166 /DNA_END=1740 /DNA_ORIENTATION=+
MKARETRLSFRPRPLDITKQLEIVRDSKELDDQDGNVSRQITHSHEALDAENEQVLMVQNKKARGGKEIPIPEVGFVPTYKKDYYPLYKPPVTYLHGKPGQSYYGPNFVEYNLEMDDLKWLDDYTGHTGILTEENFELMLWKLEVACAEATDRTLVAAGASHADRMSPAACASLEHFTRDSAMEVLKNAVPYRQPVLDDVYNYWYNKRKERQKPLMRRLQAPTSVSDTNPFNVFRPRERVNRPQTRRKRENDMTSYEKMKAMQQNLQSSVELMEQLIRREYKKRDLVNYEVDIQQLQLHLRHELRARHEQIEADALAAFKARQKRMADLERDSRDDRWLDRVQAALIENPTGLLQVGSNDAREALRKASKRKRRIERRPNLNAVASLPPPLPRAPEEMQFLYQVDVRELEPDLVASHPSLCRGGVRARIGRGGRLMFDRWVPDFAQPFDPRFSSWDDSAGGECDAKRDKSGGLAGLPGVGQSAGATGSPGGKKRGPGRPSKVEKKPGAANGQHPMTPTQEVAAS